MFPAPLSDRLDALIDDLILDGGIESASLASILLAAKDSVQSDCLISLSKRVWAAKNDMQTDGLFDIEGFSLGNPDSDALQGRHAS